MSGYMFQCIYERFTIMNKHKINLKTFHGLDQNNTIGIIFIL